MSDQIYVLKGTEKVGPYSADELRRLLEQRQFTPNDLAWREGLYDWQPILTLFGAPPPPPTTPGQYVPGPGKPMGQDLGMRLLLPVGRSGWAIAAGYLGLFSALIFPAPIALIISLIAIRDISKSKNSPQKKYGMGRAVFGLIMGLGGTIVLLMILVSWLNR